MVIQFLSLSNCSSTGLTSFHFGDVRFLTLDQWVAEFRNYERICTIPFFLRFKKTKSFQTVCISSNITKVWFIHLLLWCYSGNELSKGKNLSVPPRNCRRILAFLATPKCVIAFSKFNHWWANWRIWESPRYWPAKLMIWRIFSVVNKHWSPISPPILETFGTLSVNWYLILAKPPFPMPVLG